MNVHPRHTEASSTAQRTTLDLAVATIPSLFAGGVALASLIKGRDLRVDRPHSRLVVAIEVAQVLSVAEVIISRGIAIHNRHTAGMGLLDRHASAQKPQVLAGAVVGVPIAVALHVRRLRRGSTLLRKHPITKIGKAQGVIALSYAVFSGGAAAAELYRTREEWLPEVKDGIDTLKSEAALVLLKRKIKQHPPVAANTSDHSSLDELVLTLAALVVKDLDKIVKDPGSKHH